MKISGEVIRHFIIIATIIDVSLEECNRKYGSFLTEPFWSGVRNYRHVGYGTVAYCTDLSELNIKDYEKLKINAIEIKNNGTVDEIWSGLFKGFSNTLALNIINGNVRYIEPGALDDLPNLEVIDLSGNNLIVLDEGTFNNQSYLKVIDISRNKISCLDVSCSSASYGGKSCSSIKCESLQLLDLSDNEVKNLEISNCTNMRVLRLGGNNIEDHSLSEMKIHDLPLLKHLNLSRNKLTCVRLAVDELVSNTSCPLVNCGSLLSLDLSNNRLEDVEFANCAGLNELILSGNCIKQLEVGTLKNLSITILDLTDNKLNHITSEHLNNLANLRSLNLSRNSLFAEDDMAPNLFYGIGNLRTLNLSSTSIKRLTFGTFSLIPYMETLDLSFNKLTYIPRYFLTKLYSIRRLYLNGNQLTSFNGLFFVTVDLNDNLLKCSNLLEMTSNYRVSLIEGRTYNATNFRGIKCEADVQNETKVNEDLVALEKEYLSFLVRGQDDLKQKIVELRYFLNESSIHQKNYTRSSMESVEDTLLVKDAILYGICLVGFAMLVMFLTFYYRYLRKDVREDRILTTFHAST